MRKQEIENDKLYKILVERGKHFKEMEEIENKLVELDKERTKVGYKLNRLKEKTKPIIDNIDFKLGEFEFVSKVYINDMKMPEVEILDQIEEYKKAILEQRKDENTANK